MSFDLMHIWSHMGLLSKLIAGCLVLMAIASIAVAVERTIAIRKSAAESRLFVKKAEPLLDTFDIDGLIRVSATYKNSALAKLFGNVARRYQRAVERNERGLSPVESARKESERSLEALGAQLRSGMSILASVGSVAPFVGLLGTVVGIIGAFQGIASSGSGGLGAVSVGIAEALIETALGLMVAIPAVLLFNWLSTKVASVEMALGRSAGELLEELESRDGYDVVAESQRKLAA